MKLDKIMIIGIIFLLISPINLLFSLNHNLVRVGEVNINEYEPVGIIVEDNVAYIAGNNILEIVSVGDPNFMFQLGRTVTNGSISGIYKENELIYVASGNNGFEIIDVTNVLDPFSIGTHYDLITVRDIFVIANTAFLAVEGAGLHILNVTDPINVSLIGSYHDSTDHATKIYVENSIAYLGEYSNGLKIIDISDPSNPHLLGHYDKTIYDIHVKDNIAYLVLSEGEEFSGIEIVDMTDPTTPRLISRIPIQTYGIHLSNQFIYIPIEYEELVLYDISNSEKPRKTSQYPFPS
ncbi:MAG: LVIVD repeat-containing protein, partial [Candidatus Hodarchaeales archaeon]